MSTAVDVLLVEDHVGDVLLVREALTPFGDQVRLHVAGDGHQALQLLSDPNFPRPRFMLMDLHTPRMGALDVLAEMRQRAPWDVIPVIVYSSSALPADVLRAHRAGANAYLVKPTDFDTFCEVLGLTVRFWMSTVSPVETPRSATSE